MATNERKIKVTIDVDDAKAKEAAKSLDRLGAAAKNVGKEGKGIQEMETGLGASAAAGGRLAAVMGTVASVVAAAVVVIAALGAAAMAAAKYGYEFAKSFADVGSALGKAREATGLSIKTLAALNAEVERAGGSWEGVLGAVKDFQKVIAGANTGSKEATAKLNRLGIDGKKAANDIEGSFKLALKKIAELPAGVQRSAAAMDAFGDSGQALIPFFMRFNGDIDKLLGKLTDYGVIMGEEDVKASKEFNAALADVQTELRGVGLTIGRELLPVARDLFKSFNGFYKENKAEIKDWAVYVADIFRGVISGMSSVVKFLRENWKEVSGAARTVAAVLTLGSSEVNGRMLGSAVNSLAASGAGQRGGTFGDPQVSQLRSQLLPQTSLLGNFTAVSPALVNLKPGDPIAAALSTPKSYLPDALTAPKGSSNVSKAESFQLSSRARAVIQAADKLGVSPLDLATIISYETVGTFSPNIVGGKGNNYQGLIQFGPEERKQFGVYKGQSFEDQVTNSVVKYFQTRFNSVGRTTQGATLLDLYKTVNGGNPNVSSSASDGNGTIGGHVARMQGSHRRNALQKLFGGSISNIPADGSGSTYEEQMRNIIQMDNQQYEASRFAALAKLYQSGNVGASDDFIKKYTDFINKSEPLDRNKKSESQIAEMLSGSVLGGPLSTSGNVEFSPISNRSDDYLRNLKESLGIREQELEIAARLEKHYEIMAEYEKASKISQENYLIGLGQQYEVQQRLIGDEAYTQREREINLLTEKMGLERQIFDLQNDLANSGLNDSLKIQAAALEDIIEMREREVSAVMQINRLNLELANKGVYSENQATASVLEHLNSVKGVTEVYADARKSVIDLFWNGIDSAVGRVTAKMGIFGSIVKRLIVDFIRLATLKPLQNIFGGGGAASASRGGGGFSLPGIFGGGGPGGGGGIGGFAMGGAGGSGGGFSLPSLLGFGGSAPGYGSALMNSRSGGGGFLTPDLGGFSAADSGSVRNGSFGGGISNLSSYSQMKNLFSLKGLGAMAPALGGGLGSMLGGGSQLGSILGGIGGMAGGALAGIATGALNAGTMLGGVFGAGGMLSIGGLSAAMSATVVLAPIAAALAIGARILSVNAGRRRDEKTRDAGMVSALKALNDIKAEMEEARPGINTKSLIDQALQVQKEYYEMANGLKSNKTRKIAIKDGRERVDPLVTQIQELATGANLKQEIRAAAAERDRRILPEFAEGGMVRAKQGGHLAVIGEGGYDEYILSTDPKHSRRTAGLLSKFLERMNFNVPKMAAGGTSSGSVSSAAVATGNATIVNEITVNVDQDANGIWTAAATSSNGQEVIARIVEKKVQDRTLKLRKS